MISPYEGANIRVRMDSTLPEECEIHVQMHQRSMLSPFLYAIVVDVVI